MTRNNVKNGVLINLIIPLSETESDSLESHLFKTVVNRRGFSNEEVFVIPEPTTSDGFTFNGITLMGYKFHHTLENNEAAIDELQIQVIHFAREWMINAGKPISLEH
jgi:hypothetical protein